ncbi:maleylpyruvate isomerase family mycothiol-dependent enzyme [Kineosporia sp. R_H_3]|uniref:maleylpyruvate isomerase family mycothiol-dependent enzyme n=1 Tax=Kineosporia sp. R_H_3 TaxID=1961848 RepID=UPI000B4B58AE|nr:maleylpyruvate isomerase family mycothiol-dependent enzyme [Kineosporia sp. R_H_3]
MTHTETLAFVAAGTTLCADAIAGLDEAAFAAPSALPGWTRKHLVTHLAANAEALMRLLHWATTGERTPMYSSPEQRNADIEAGTLRPGADLAHWFTTSAARLDDALAAMPEAAWAAEIVTAQGRTVPASQIPWMRAREVLVHAADLGTGVTFADLPEPFLTTLGEEIRAKRSGAGEPVGELAGSLPDVTAYLAGRGTSGVTTTDGAPAPAPSPWL